MPRTTITLEQLARLSIDETNRLYWDDEKIITQTMIDLPTWVDIAVGIAAIAGTVAVVIRVLEYFGIRPSGKQSATSQTSGGGSSAD